MAATGDRLSSVRLAAVQAASVPLDRDACVAKACRLIAEAGAAGADVVVFPEGFIPAHPLWFHFQPATSPLSRRLSAELFRQAVEIPSEATEALAAAARGAGAHVVMGLCEKEPGTLGTLWNTQLFIGPGGELLGKHRKLTPTVGERLVHTGGHGDTLHAVEGAFGRLSGLICGENSNPLAIAALIAESPVVHAAAWPPAPARGMLSRADRAAMTGRALAFMAKAFVVNACGVVDDALVEAMQPGPEDRRFLADRSLTGGSSIVAPDSRVVAGPMGGEEGILVADVELDECVHEKVVHDFNGHYNRDDVFTLLVADGRPALVRRASADRHAAPVTNEKERHVPHVTFDSDEENLVSGSYSTGTGPVLRSKNMEVTKIAFEKGKGADRHSHPEEQVMYVLSGRLRVTCGDETYEVGPGEATFNPSNVPHAVMAIEDTVGLSFKNQVAPIYEATGSLAG